MLPCLRDVVKIPPLFGVVPIQPFGVLVGIGLVVGYLLARRRAKATGLDPDLCADGMVWTVVVGFVVGAKLLSGVAVPQVSFVGSGVGGVSVTCRSYVPRAARVSLSTQTA